VQLDTDQAQTTVAATGTTTATITPPSDGHRSLTVWAKDRAGNLSLPNVYAFQVGSAALAQPLPGATVVRRAKLSVDSVVPQYTRGYFEYRRGPGGSVLPVPSANLTNAMGAAITAAPGAPVDLASLGGYAVWNATDTLGAVGGVAELRAQLYTSSSPSPMYATAWVRINVDPNGDGSATDDVGPGSANLLTGDYTMSSIDADELGLKAARTTSSRSPADGLLPMGERLTANQQQVSTDLTGFTVPATTSAVRVTSRGQGETTPTDSLEITPVSGNDTYVTVGGDNGGLRLNMQSGKTYRMTGWIYVPGSTGLVPSLVSRAMRIVAFYRDSAGNYHEYASAKANYTDAWQELTVDLPVAADATEAFFRLYDGMAGGTGKRVYFDHLSMAEVVAPLGPSWRATGVSGTANVDYTTITFPEASVARVNLAGGDWITFSRNADGVTYTPEPGSEGMVLSKYDANTYRLTELDGTVSEFTLQGAQWTVSSSWTPQSGTTTHYAYDTSNNRTLLTRVINPAEPGVDDTNHCATTVPARGCEVMEYIYATATTPGLSQTVFGNVVDQVSTVRVWSWDPVTGTEAPVDVARYTYDNLGQLREEWDARISPALKTTYEYDARGRVTKTTPPGELPWMYDYGAPDVDTAALRWNFDEAGGGSTVDASGSGRTGTFAGGAGWGQGNDAAYAGDGAATFTAAAGQAVAAPGAVVNTTQSFTVSAWVNLNDAAANRTAVSQDGSRTSGFFINYVQATNRWAFSRVTCDCDSATAVRASSNAPPALGTWTHLTGVYDTAAGQMRLYVNGVLQSTTAPTGNWSAGGPLVVGRAKWAGAVTNTWSGSIDDVRVYQQVLTADQIATLAGDENPGRLLRVRRAALQQGSKTVTDGETASSLVYHVPLARSLGGPYDLDSTAIATWGQKDLPTDATAIYEPEDTPPTSSATATVPGSGGYPYATVHYLDAGGQEVNTANPGGHIDTNEYDKFGNVVRSLEASNRELALGTMPGAESSLAQLGLASSDTATRAMALSTVNTYSTDGQDVLDTVGPTLNLVLDSALTDPNGQRPMLPAGTTVIGRPHTVNVYDEGKPDGATYHLRTTETTGAQVVGYPDADARVTKTGYSAERGGTSGWVLKKATSTIADAGPGGVGLTSYIVYDSGGRTTATWGIGATGTDARTSLTVSYTAGPNPADAACGNKPEWAGQPCVTQAGGAITGQRADMSSDLPVKRIEVYDRSGRATQLAETAAGKTRRTLTTYDSAGRVSRSDLTSDEGVTVPSVTTTYDPTTGQIASTSSGSVTLAREYDLLGRQVTYTDADGGVTHHEFDRYGKPVRIADNSGTQTLTYDRSIEPRGFLTSTTDSVAGTFSAKYSPDGQLVELDYPGGLTRRDTLDASFNPVQRTYTRDSDGQVIYAESVVENSHGQRVSHTFTGGSRTYGYDRTGRLASVQDTDPTAGCTTRQYGYDGRTNRVSRQVFNPATGGACRTDTPDAQETHGYDSADRITDAGYVYDAFGRTTALPDGLTNTYYANDLVASQQLGDTRQSWTTYPDLRLRGSVTESLVDGVWTQTASKTNHYGDDTDRPRWITEDAGTGGITRNVSGPDGDLCAITSATGDVALQLTNLHGDVVEIIDTGLTTPEIHTFDEFGNAPAAQNQQRYGWLGGKQRSDEALGGVVLMGVRLYSPTLGRFLQVDPMAGGSANAYDYCYADAVNCTDLDGRWGWLNKIGNAVKSAGSFLYNHASDIGTGLGIVACFTPPPFNAIIGAVAVGFSLVGAYKEFHEGHYAGGVISLLGAIPGAGAVVKGVKAIRAGRAAVRAGMRIARYVPKYGSKASKMKDLVRPFRKAKSAAKRAEHALRPWERWHRRATVFESGRMACKYTSCRHSAPYGHYWVG
jgi:RHS repeat-associated protein